MRPGESFIDYVLAHYNSEIEIMHDPLVTIPNVKDAIVELALSGHKFEIGDSHDREQVRMMIHQLNKENVS